MTVLSKSNDVAGTVLDVDHATLTAAVAAAPANGAQYFAAVAAQTQKRAELVLHHLGTGRLSGHAVLAASIFGPTGAAALSIPANDVGTAALQTAINAISTAASFQQFSNQQLKDQLEREFLQVLLQRGYTTNGAILASTL